MQLLLHPKVLCYILTTGGVGAEPWKGKGGKLFSLTAKEASCSPMDLFGPAPALEVAQV